MDWHVYPHGSAPTGAATARTNRFRTKEGWWRWRPSILALTAAGAIGLCVLAGAAPANAQITLSHITTNEVDSSGNFALSNFWDTDASVGNGAFDIFLIQGTNVNGTILNSVTREPSLLLSAGANTFTLLMEPGSLSPGGGLNLFFNGSNNSSISGYSTFGVTATPPASGLGKTVYDPYGPPELGFAADTGPGAGLTFAGPGGTTATLTSLRFFNSGVDRVNSNDVVASGAEDFGVTFTVNVTAAGMAAPEPGTFALMAGTALGVAGVRLRRRRR